MVDNGYRLKYRDKWIKPKRILGSYIYELCDTYENIKLLSLNDANSWKNILCRENDELSKEEVEIIEFNEKIVHKNILRKYLI